MNCPKCGNNNQEGSIFCNKCGTNLQIKDNQSTDIEEEQQQEKLETDSTDKEVINKKQNDVKSKWDEFVANKKVFIPTSIIVGLIVIIGIIFLSIKPPSVTSVFNKIKDYDTEEAITYLNEVYPDDGGFLGWFEEENLQYKSEILLLLIDNLENKFESQHGVRVTDYKAVKILDVNIKRRSYSSDYVDIEVTVNNGGESSVNYIKINLFYEDENGNIIKSDWTNDSSVIRPGASQVITSMTEIDGWQTVRAEIADIRF